ncbi:MAG: hypothetical protein ACR2J6_05375 [Thermoleophilaceae bacterium]
MAAASDAPTDDRPPSGGSHVRGAVDAFSHLLSIAARHHLKRLTRGTYTTPLHWGGTTEDVRAAAAELHALGCPARIAQVVHDGLPEGTTRTALVTPNPMATIALEPDDAARTATP